MSAPEHVTASGHLRIDMFAAADKFSHAHIAVTAATTGTSRAAKSFMPI